MSISSLYVCLMNSNTVRSKVQQENVRSNAADRNQCIIQCSRYNGLLQRDTMDHRTIENIMQHQVSLCTARNHPKPIELERKDSHAMTKESVFFLPGNQVPVA